MSGVNVMKKTGLKIIKRYFALLTLVVSGLMLSGCETFRPMPVKEPQMVAQPEGVTVRLAEAADRASRSLETLAAVEKTRNPEAAAAATIPNAPRELRRTMSIRWYGKPAPLLQQIADRAGYNFKTIGKEPPAPLIVAINAEDRILIDMLRDVGLQLGGKSHVKVDASRRMIELHYPSALGSSREVR